MDKPRITIRLSEKLPVQHERRDEADNSKDNKDNISTSTGYSENRKVSLFHNETWTEIRTAPRKNRSKGWLRSPWFRLGFAVFSAAGLGVVLGFVVLSVFVEGNLDSQAMIRNVNHSLPERPQELQEGQQRHVEQQEGQQVGPVEGTSPGGKTSGEIASAAVAAPLQIPEKTLYMVQAGVFSSPASAEPAITFFHSKHWPVILMDGDSSRLFVGVAGQQADAAEIARFYKEQNVEIYIKEWKIPAANPLLTGEQGKHMPQLRNFLLDGQSLLEQIAAANVRGLREGGRLQQAEWEGIVAKHRRFLQGSREGLPAFSAEVQKLGEQMTNDMTRAVTAMEEYLRQPVAAYVWQAQQGLLNYVAGYEKLLALLRQ